MCNGALRHHTVCGRMWDPYRQCKCPSTFPFSLLSFLTLSSRVSLSLSLSSLPVLSVWFFHCLSDAFLNESLTRQAYHIGLLFYVDDNGNKNDQARITLGFSRLRICPVRLQITTM